MKKLDEKIIDIGGVPDFGTLVKDSRKLLKICATRLPSMVVGCSGAIITHLGTS